MPHRIGGSALAVFCLLLTLPLQPALGWETWSLDEYVLPEWLSLSVTHRTRYEYLDDPFRVGPAGEQQVIVLRTLVHGRASLIDGVTVGAELQDSRVEFDDAAFLTTTIVNPAELLRAYLEVEKADLLGGTLTGQAGRLTMDVGSRRLVARNLFRNTINGFTGIDIGWRGDGELEGRELRAFWALPVQRLPNRQAQLKDNDIEFDSESCDVQFWGVFGSSKLPWLSRGELFLFGIHERDSGGRPTRNRQLITPGFRFFRAAGKGRFDYEFETALQLGESRASIASTRDLDHFAHFHHVALGYTFDTVWSPRLVLQYDYASGDDDPNDGKNQRFDTLYGARRFEFGPTGIYGPFARSNLNTPGVRLELKPLPSVSSFIAYRGFWLASDRDAWVTTGVRDTTGNSGSFVASQLELRVVWNVLPGNLKLEAGYAHLFAGDFIDEAPNSNRKGDTNYGYTQIVLGF
jgi:hypothetical protein